MFSNEQNFVFIQIYSLLYLVTVMVYNDQDDEDTCVAPGSQNYEYVSQASDFIQ